MNCLTLHYVKKYNPKIASGQVTWAKNCQFLFSLHKVQTGAYEKQEHID